MKQIISVVLLIFAIIIALFGFFYFKDTTVNKPSLISTLPGEIYSVYYIDTSKFEFFLKDSSDSDGKELLITKNGSEARLPLSAYDQTVINIMLNGWLEVAPKSAKKILPPNNCKYLKVFIYNLENTTMKTIDSRFDLNGTTRYAFDKFECTSSLI